MILWFGNFFYPEWSNDHGFESIFYFLLDFKKKCEIFDIFWIFFRIFWRFSWMLIKTLIVFLLFVLVSITFFIFFLLFFYDLVIFFIQDGRTIMVLDVFFSFYWIWNRTNKKTQANNQISQKKSSKFMIFSNFNRKKLKIVHNTRQNAFVRPDLTKKLIELYKKWKKIGKIMSTFSKFCIFYQKNLKKIQKSQKIWNNSKIYENPTFFSKPSKMWKIRPKPWSFDHHG